MQERCNSSALAMELHLSCINPSISFHISLQNKILQVWRRVCLKKNTGFAGLQILIITDVNVTNLFTSWLILYCCSDKAASLSQNNPSNEHRKQLSPAPSISKFSISYFNSSDHYHTITNMHIYIYIFIYIYTKFEGFNKSRIRKIRNAKIWHMFYPWTWAMELRP